MVNPTRRAWALAAAFVAAGLVAVQLRTFLNNERVFTWMFAGLTSESPLELIFLLKARPPISLLYAPVAAIGFTPFLWAHVLVSALAVPLTADLARRLGHPRPLLAALLVASSPMFFAGAVAGVQNSEAVVGVVAVAWLLSRGQPLAAGLLLGVVVIARVETAVFALALALWSLRTPDWRRLLPGAVALPALFALAGALYHGDALWPLHYPSSLFDNPAVSPEARARYGGTPSDLVSTLLGLTPALGLLLWWPARAGTALERTLICSALAFLVAIRILPFTHLVYVDASPRYVLPALPFLALGMARAADALPAAGWGTLWRAALLVGGGALLTTVLPDDTVRSLWAAIGLAVGPALLALATPSVALPALAAVALALTVAATLVPRALPLIWNTHLLLGGRARQLDESTDWIAANVPPGAVVVTDVHLLARWMADRGAPPVDLRHVIEPDMRYEARALTNPATRQYEAIFGTRRFFYAPWIVVEDIEALPGEVYFVMRTDRLTRSTVQLGAPFDRVEWERHDGWMAGRLPRPEAGR